MIFRIVMSFLLLLFVGVGFVLHGDSKSSTSAGEPATSAPAANQPSPPANTQPAKNFNL